MRGGRLALDVGDDPLGRLDVTVDGQPARALRDPAPQKKHNEAERRTGLEGNLPPGKPEDRPEAVEHEHRAQRAESRAQPEAAVDDKTRTPAGLRRHELLHRRADCRVLTADAEPRDETQESQRPEAL